MSFLDPLVNALLAPLKAFKKEQNAVAGFKGGVKGGVERLKQVPKQYKGAAEQVKGAAGKAQAGQQKAGKMGLFSKKKKCPSCGEKLHASWDQCPYCGWSDAPAPAAAAPAAAAPAPSPAGGKMRTMAIDASGGGGKVANSSIGWLVPLDGPQTGELFQLKGRAIVGTAPDCDAVMKDPSISGRHAELSASGSGFRINDLGSTNGTFVNDKRVTTSDLIDGDNVKMGRVNFKFKTVT